MLYQNTAAFDTYSPWLHLLAKNSLSGMSYFASSGNSTWYAFSWFRFMAMEKTYYKSLDIFTRRRDLERRCALHLREDRIFVTFEILLGNNLVYQLKITYSPDNTHATTASRHFKNWSYECRSNQCRPISNLPCISKRRHRSSGSWRVRIRKVAENRISLVRVKSMGQHWCLSVIPKS